MGRPPSNGAPSFRFNAAEVAEMEAILQAENHAVPPREVLADLADKFSAAPERSGKVVVQMKQVWNWFQNRRYALRARAGKSPGKLSVSPMPQDDPATVRNVPHAPQPLPAPPGTMRNVPQAPQPLAAPSVQSVGRKAMDDLHMEFEAKSARDGAWYDVAVFLSYRHQEKADPEVMVRFAGFGPEEDEWVNVRKHIRQRSLPCESSECVAVLPGDLILCFQEGKEQALYFDAHVLDAQRRRHDVRGCRCRFLVRYDHDQSEEIVPLRKVCRRPETDYRLQQLHAINDSAKANQHKTGADPHIGNTLRVFPPAEAAQKRYKAEEHADAAAVVSPASHINVPVAKVLQPKIAAESVGAMEISNVQPANVAVSGGAAASNMGNSDVQLGSIAVSCTATDTTIGGSVTSDMGNSNVHPSDIAVSGAATATTTGGSSTGNMGNSNLQPSSIAVCDPATDTTIGGSGTSDMGNSDVQPSDIAVSCAATATTIGGSATSNMVNSNLQPSDIAVGGTATDTTTGGSATCNMGNSNVQQSDIAVSGAATATTTGGSATSNMGNSNIQPSDIAVGGTATDTTTGGSATSNMGNSNVQPSDIAVIGAATDTTTGGAATSNMGNSNLQPSDIAVIGTATATTTGCSATSNIENSNVQPSNTAVIVTVADTNTGGSIQDMMQE